MTCFVYISVVQRPSWADISFTYNELPMIAGGSQM